MTVSGPTEPARAHSPLRARPADPNRESVETVDEHGARVQSMFSSIAHGYDRANRLMSLGSDQSWRKRAVQAMAPALAERPDAAVLDLCAGTLDSAMEIHRQYPRAQITAGDFSAGMLERGRERLQGSQNSAITTVEMDAHAIPLADGSQRAAFCAFGMRNLSRLDVALAELRRVLQPGGRLVVLDFFRPKGLLTRGVHQLYNRTALPLIGWVCTGNLDAYRYLPRSIGAFETAADFVTALDAAGFRGASVHPLALGVTSIIVAESPGESP